MTESLWTESQKQAWGYVESGINRGMGQVEALREYRSGGGKIRTQAWGELWHRYGEAGEEWGKLYQLKGVDIVPESMFERVNIRYQEKYVMTFSVDIKTKSGDIKHGIQRQVESSKRLSVSQWIEAAKQAMYEDPSDPTGSVTGVRNLEFFERME